MTIQHWLPPDIRRDILAAALRADAAEPLNVHVRPEVLARMGERPLSLGPAAPGLAIPVVVDDQLPRAPGYEVHRVAPPAPAAPATELRLEDEDRRVADPGASVPATCAVRSWSSESGRSARSRELRWLRAHRKHHRSRPV